ncbi:MAG: hypothetical protein DMF41_02080 [Verrucomicrobia bacterium]|nr:MAG: hypothetical protein DMF41_02080 [Verrucomicrobiota bacterium]
MVLFVIFCPIVAAILIMIGAPARKMAVAASVLTLGATLLLLASFSPEQHDFQEVTSFPISSEWHLSFTTGIDGLSLALVLLAAIVTVAAVWFAGKIDKYQNAFYACLLFISGGAIGAFASLDLFFFYAFHELALIPTFLLIGIWGGGNRVAAAWKITIYLAIGSFILLLGLILLYQSVPTASRSFDIRALKAAASLGQISGDAQRHIYLLLLIGFGILTSLFPFRVMHIGYIFLGIASASILGVTGAVVLMFAHGLSIALLFALAGELRKRTGTLVFEELGGLAKVMPFAGLAFGLGAFAAIGLPGFANFAGEIMIFFGAFKNGWEIGRFHIFQIATVLALWGMVISTVYMLRAYRKVFMGALNERWTGLVDLRSALRVPVTLLVGALLCYGFFPQSFVRMTTPAFRTYLTANK